MCIFLQYVFKVRCSGLKGDVVGIYGAIVCSSDGKEDTIGNIQIYCGGDGGGCEEQKMPKGFVVVGYG